MKIDKFHSNYVNNLYKTNDERKKGHVEGPTTAKSTVEISSQAKDLVKKINESEDANFSEKVESIRRSIQEGAYLANSEKIADKILEKIDSERLDKK
ncbi:flagellar biosynthesis anti-sigma factor FlgM [Alkalibacter mobilis]|uniref:flagellar biosynthesis anti-sigma factor FlgM n=1 Tax=Alkalibacter mobilis TaxID=2787712 RepID=UPI00189EE415|nr:flagellar biosynthesis anti-sigma factor FlgM [Alkalibacter mobilis]MBF7096337.1 flagellar biosynthesis anti-sigma factor FlgM [Alkalibacter mobilis]